MFNNHYYGLKITLNFAFDKFVMYFIFNLYLYIFISTKDMSMFLCITISIRSNNYINWSFISYLIEYS